MRVLTIITIIFLLIFSHGAVLSGADISGKTFYIATDGSDSNPGTFLKPFITVERARDEIRTLKRSGNMPEKGVTVYIRGGVYYLKETLAFGPEDSQYDWCPVTYCAYPGEKLVFSSGVRIGNWRRLEEEPDELPWEANGKVWVADIPETKGGKWRFYTLFDGDERLPRARCNGFAPTLPFGGRTVKTGHDTLYFPKGKVKKWKNLENVELIIRPSWPWVLNILGFKSVDESAGIAITSTPGSYPLRQLGGHAMDKTISCWIENTLEALDKPGEWVLDTREGRLYLWPRGVCPGNSIVAPCLGELIRVEGGEANDKIVKNLRFKGLTFTHGERDIRGTNSALIHLSGVEKIIIEKCEFTNSGGTAIRFGNYSQRNSITGNHISHIGGAGIILNGMSIGGVSPMDIDKWDENEPFNHACSNVVEYNEIYRTVEVLGDGNGIYLHSAGKGNIIRRNYVHHIFGTGAHTAIRTDDFVRGTLITENIVYHCVMGGFTLKHTNYVENNMFIDILDDDKNPRRAGFWGYILLRRVPSHGARIQRNIYYHSGKRQPFYFEKPMLIGEAAKLEECDADYNLFFCAGDSDWSAEYLDTLKQRGVELHSIAADPLFVDVKNEDFRLAPDSPALKLGFKPIDMSKIGLIE